MMAYHLGHLPKLALSVLQKLSIRNLKLQHHTQNARQNVTRRCCSISASRMAEMLNIGGLEKRKKREKKKRSLGIQKFARTKSVFRQVNGSEHGKKMHKRR